MREPPHDAIRAGPDGKLRPRIVLTGTGGAGKTTLGRRLSDLLGVDLFELDELPHESRPGHPLSSEELRAFLAPRLLRSEAWIVESQLSEIPPEALRRATTVLWLDLPRSVRVWRIIRRHGIVLILGKRSGHGITRRRVLGDIRHGWSAHDRIAVEYEHQLGQLDIPAEVVRLRGRGSVARWLRDLEHAVVSGSGVADTGTSM